MAQAKKELTDVQKKIMKFFTQMLDCADYLESTLPEKSALYQYFVANTSMRMRNKVNQMVMAYHVKYGQSEQTTKILQRAVNVKTVTGKSRNIPVVPKSEAQQVAQEIVKLFETVAKKYNGHILIIDKMEKTKNRSAAYVKKIDTEERKLAQLTG